MTGTKPPDDRRAGSERTERNGPDSPPAKCPECESEEVRSVPYRLVYDRPGFDFEVYHLGGFVIRDERWLCAACGHEWQPAPGDGP